MGFTFLARNRYDTDEICEIFRWEMLFVFLGSLQYCTQNLDLQCQMTVGLRELGCPWGKDDWQTDRRASELRQKITIATKLKRSKPSTR
jgi:hypothetical protein